MRHDAEAIVGQTQLVQIAETAQVKRLAQIASRNFDGTQIAKLFLVEQLIYVCHRAKF